ncbi:MAG: TerB family tellurite resistance protein [Pseudomonadota bacterium]
MISILRKLFEPDAQSGPAQELVPALAVAVIMFEVVWADHEIDDDELTIMRRCLADVFDLSSSEVDDYLNQARELHAAAVGLHEFTTALNANLSISTKRKVIHALWQIAYSDQQLDALEEHTVRRVADLLYVSHKDFIAAKLKAREASRSD